MENNFILTSRLCLEMTQEELAKKINNHGLKCSKSAVCKWEKGQRNPQQIVINLIKSWLEESTEE